MVPRPDFCPGAATFGTAIAIGTAIAKRRNCKKTKKSRTVNQRRSIPADERTRHCHAMLFKQAMRSLQSMGMST